MKPQVHRITNHQSYTLMWLQHSLAADFLKSFLKLIAGFGIVKRISSRIGWTLHGSAPSLLTSSPLRAS